MGICKTQLRKAQDRLKDFLINRLIKAGIMKMEDGRQLYELTLTELKKEYREMKTCEN
ncbi:MAG: Fur-regulated basic protein FbpA [Bacillota bacterium]|nr:Fur-regulated basic protein FbpA [Bacillota bacterium]